MKCTLCNNKKLSILTAVNGVKIYQCKKCQLALVGQNRTHRLNSSSQYNLKNYKKQEPRLRKRYEKIIRIVNQVKPKGRALDIGAGYGLLASMLPARKYQVEILEPFLTPSYAKRKNIIQHKTSLAAFAPQKKYDLVFLIDVIEHFPNPVRNLRKIKKLLAKNGLIIIQTPNYQNFMAKICHYWPGWMVKNHKQIYSPQSLKGLLRKMGFTPLRLTTYDSLYEFRESLNGVCTRIKRPSLRKLLKLLALAFTVPAYLLLRHVLWHFGWGGLIFTTAQKD